MKDRNYGLAVESTNKSNEADEYASQMTGNSVQSTVGYAIQAFGYAMVLLYCTLLVAIIVISYGILL